MSDKIRLDMANLTLGDMEDASELLGGSVSEALQGAKREAALVALATVVIRHTDPSFTREQARRIRMADLDVVNADAEGEVPAASNGGERALSPATGT